VAELKGVPTWNDINPRLGVAYDVFGNGRTAVKVSFGRYNQLSRSDLTRRFHPFSSSISSAFRNWNDANGNYIPDCDVQNFSANGECGAISNANFGKFIPSSTIFDDSVTKTNRDYLWDVNLDVQHELVHGLALNFGYNHNWDGSFTVTQTVLKAGTVLRNGAVVTADTPLGPSNYDEFCLTVPNDPRLPNAGQQRCGFYDIQPQYFGLGTLRVTNARDFENQNGNSGLPKRYWDGFWIGLDGRLPRGIRVGGGLDMGRNVDDHCFTVDIPGQPRDITGSSGGTTWNGFNSSGAGACKVVTSWANTMDVRLNGSVPIKGGFNGSFIYRNTVGDSRNATYAASAANVAFTNGRAASTLTTAQTVNLITPNSSYGSRFSQLDLAINKSVDIGWGKVRLAFDVYNALNSNSIQNSNSAYSAIWTRPTTFLDPRLARVTAALQF